MKTLAHAFTIAAMLILLVGCGGSSVDLPEEVINDDAYAMQWTDFKAIKPDEGVKLLGDMADDMSDEQPKARLWLSAEADEIDGNYRERWDAFTQAGCEGMLTVYYRVQTTEGKGEEKTTDVAYRRHTFIKAKKGAKSDDLEKALEQFAEDDGVEKLKLESVGKESVWFWVTREDASDNSPKMPKGGDEKNAKAFDKLLAKGDGAAIIAAWRMIKGIAEEIDDELKNKDLTDDREDELKLAKSTQSVVMACSPGKGATLTAIADFVDSKQAKAFAQGHNDRLIDARASVKKQMINVESPPHPSVIDGLFKNMQAKPSGKTVTLKIDRKTVGDMINLSSSMMGQGGDLTSPAPLLDFDGSLHMLGASDVPGIRACYDQLKFDRSRQPQ